MNKSDSKPQTGSSWHSFKRLLNDYGRKHWAGLILAVLLALSASLSPYVYGYMNRIMLDDVLEVGSNDDIEESTEIESRKTQEEKTKFLGLMFPAPASRNMAVSASLWAVTPSFRYPG